jgi:serpin B
LLIIPAVAKTVTTKLQGYKNAIVKNKNYENKGSRMNQGSKSGLGEKFLQRRYGVRLGRRYVVAAASVILMGVLSCSQFNKNDSATAQSSLPPSEFSPSKTTSSVDEKLVLANTKFGFKLFSEILKEDKEKNIFVSPSSVGMALTMTYNGASGNTQKAMAKALELEGISLGDIGRAIATLKSSMVNPDPKVQLAIANSLWANKNITLKPEFLQQTRQYYDAEVSNLDFQDNKSVNVINQWVNKNTQGKIEKIIDKISPDQALFLINAIYFKGKWQTEFDKNQTKMKPFYLASGKSKEHSMMSQKGKYKYYENENFQAISLPYGDNGRMSLYVFLPTKNSNLKIFNQNLNAENWQKWMQEFNSREGFIQLPKFQLDYEIQLNKALKALGMNIAFTDKADFSNMGKKLAISEVKHKTFVEVNEEGTEAAGATSVGVVTLSAPSEQPFRMVVDRPFFTAIRDNQTGSLLFMGYIVEPK